MNSNVAFKKIITVWGNEKMTKCKVCGVNLPDDANFCYECGAKQKNTCLKCRARLLNNAKFCHKCGAEQYLMVDNDVNAPCIAKETSMIAFMYTKSNYLYILTCLRHRYPKNIVIPRVFSEIKEEAFANCSRLKSITIPNSVSIIGYRAFANCSNLISVTLSWFCYRNSIWGFFWLS